MPPDEDFCGDSTAIGNAAPDQSAPQKTNWPGFVLGLRAHGIILSHQLDLANPVP
jgi:hypothetical protein